MTDIEQGHSRGTIAPRGAPSSASSVVREDATGTTIERARETAQASLAAQATAQVQASYIMARQHPRSWDVVRVKVLEAAKRLGFAQAAVYQKPQRVRDPKTGRWDWGTIDGLSIRAAEEFLRTAGNIRAGSMAMYDDDEKRIVAIYAIELESNAILESSVTVTKTVERSGQGAEDRLIIATRKNSRGDIVHLCEATDDELRQKQGSAVSRERRNLILALMPADIRDELLAKCLAVKKAAIAEDPGAERKAIVDAFWAVKVSAEDLEAYLQHRLDQCSPGELETLRGILVAIRDNEITWHELMAEREKPPDERKAETRANKVVERIRSKRGSRGAAAEGAPASSGPTGPAASKQATATSSGASGPAPKASTATGQTTLPGAAAASSPTPKNTHRGEPTDGEPPPGTKLEGDR
jgi:hypothetical protein